MLENNWARLLNKSMYAVTISSFTFPISKELYIKKKKKDDHGFLSYTKH